ncbi:serine hydrolase [Puniceibacterium sediminis]|nr:serine hydrolase [Puniceibacterium sediminis]
MAHAQPSLPVLAIPEPIPAPPMTVLLPVPQDRIESAIVSLDDLGQEMLERSGIPGLAIGVVQNGDIVYMRGFGVRTAGQPTPVDPNTVFLLASLSKAVGATVVAQQVGEGRVDWTSPVRDFLPWFDMGDAWVSDHVTIGDLYAHRSGLPDHAGDDLEDIGYDRRAVLQRLGLLPQHAFRAHYAYTNFGLTVAAEAVATAVGIDWADLSENVLYGPLGMTSTSSRHADFMARENRASSHIITDGHYVETDLRQPDAQSPAGGVSSSVRDMSRWMAMVLNDGTIDGLQVVPAEALRPALSPQMISRAPMATSARTSSYGYGFNVGVRPSGRVELSHSGAFALGAATSFTMIPDLGLGIVVLTNAPPTGAAEAISASFADRVELGQDSRDWLSGYAPLMAALTAPVGSLVGVPAPTTPEMPRPNAAYVGTYENEYFGATTVEEVNGRLVLRLGPDQHTLTLTHWDKDSFVAHPVTENQPEGSVSRVDFASIDRIATTVRIEHLDHEGLGRFERLD